jgi:DNA helicase-2/ATP-dependent DNA helicase PcrA
VIVRPVGGWQALAAAPGHNGQIRADADDGGVTVSTDQQAKPLSGAAQPDHAADLDALPTSVRERLARLAPDQRAAATAPPGPVLCVAPAGSGKTTTLVARIAWRVALGADPRSVCAVTFNRRAAEELRERLDAALTPLGVAPGSAQVRTFHALGMRILRSAGVDVSRLADRATVIRTLAGGPLPPATMRILDDAFTRLTLDPERGPPTDQADVHAAYAAYRAALASDRMIDMDDLVAGALRALREDAALLARWCARAAVLLVDESQDLDRSQLDLALLLAGERRDVFLVGDDDQTIYAWRLADVRRILGLAAQLPGLERVDLTVNYRCPPEVVRRADRLVSCVTERFVKRIDPAPNATGTLVLAPDTGDDMARARRLLTAWFGRTDEGYSILARTNAELAPYAAVAAALGIPTQGAEDRLALDHPVVDRILARAEATADADPMLLRLASALERPDPDDPDGAIGRSLLAWAAGYGTLADLRAALARARSRPTSAKPGGTLVLATAHGTKGLEFDHVAVVGMDEGTFPSGRSVDEAPDPARALDEERRLAYVAWTRARRELVLVHDPYAPSVFLREAFDPRELEPA